MFFISGQHRTIPALRLKHRSGGCGTSLAVSALRIMRYCLSNFSGSGRTMCATMSGMCIQCPLHIINQSVGRDASSRRGETLPFTTNAANYL